MESDQTQHLRTGMSMEASKCIYNDINSLWPILTSYHNRLEKSQINHAEMIQILSGMKIFITYAKNIVRHITKEQCNNIRKHINTEFHDCFPVSDTQTAWDGLICAVGNIKDEIQDANDITEKKIDTLKQKIKKEIIQISSYLVFHQAQCMLALERTIQSSREKQSNEEIKEEIDGLINYVLLLHSSLSIKKTK